MDDCRNAGAADWPLHRSARRQTAGRRRFPQWFPSLWYVGTGASSGSRSTTWPGPAALTAETATPQALTAKMGDDQWRSGCVVWGLLTNGVLRRQLHVVCVEELQKGAVHWVGELAYLDHFLHVLIPVGLKHGSEVFTPAQHVASEQVRWCSFMLSSATSRLQSEMPDLIFRTALWT